MFFCVFLIFYLADDCIMMAEADTHKGSNGEICIYRKMNLRQFVRSDERIDAVCTNSAVPTAELDCPSCAHCS